MSDFSVDIEKWKNEHLFLKDIWNLYENFNNPVSPFMSNVVYIMICRSIKTILNDNEGKYHNLCLKLVQNLYSFYNNTIALRNNSEYCMILNNWVYYLIRQHSIPDHIIDNIFNQTKISASVKDKEKICSYNSYSKLFKEPEKIIELNNFGLNTHIIGDILLETGHTNKDSCQKYVKECIKIYKCMNKKNCSGKNKDHIDNKKTCSQLDNFRSTYELLFRFKPQLTGIIPSLSSEDVDHLSNCSSFSSYFSFEKNKVPKISVEDTNPGNQVLGVPTSLGIMAGVSSVFALLYKITPAGRWINSGLVRNRGRTNNNVYGNGINELLFEGNLHNEFNSYNIGYEAA
ncbi:PIR protein [Plasmodium vivax]|uniref:VIR protein n=1 Tax=Plasmodium vivax TaxID=5855 RepID=A0A565A3L4_PLAVI|nr:PIR protein [Plasmodium vivax]